MELSEAKEILEHELKYNESLNKTTKELLENKNLHWSAPYASNFEIDLHRRTRVNNAIDTILKALDNSISKEYHEMTIKEQNDIINDLKNRLDNSISKDEVKKLSNDAFEVNTHEYGTLFVVPYDNIQELLGE